MSTITGTPGDDILTGTDSDDFIDGGTGKNIISAGGGNDNITDTGTNSVIDGGTGTDRLVLLRGQLSSFSGTFTPGETTSFSDGTTIQNIEQLDLQTGAGDDTVTFIHPVQDTQWSGGAGNDTAVIDLSNMSAGFTLGRPNSDNMAEIALPNNAGALLILEDVESLRLTGGLGSDRFYGGDHDDVFYGGSGNDILLGNGGNDILRGDAGTNILDGGAGTDTAVFSGLRSNYTIAQNADGSVTVSTSGETDTLTNIEYMQFSDQTIATPQSGGKPNIVLNGTSADDILVGTSLGDKIFGLGGNDWLIGEGGDDVLSGDDGTDTAYFHGTNAYINLAAGTASSAFDGNDTLSGIEWAFCDGANATIIGDDGPNQLTAQGGGSNMLVGAGGNDSLYGNSGSDTFRGGTGNNTLSGGDGTDTAAFSRAPGSYLVTLNADGSYTVKAPDETDTLTNIEDASFDATGQTLTLSQFASQSFNPLTYIASYGDLIHAFGDNQTAALNHYVTQGYYEGRSASFNALAYTASYSDLTQAFGDNQTAALEHYVNFGFREGRAATFNALDYTASYADLIQAFGDNQTAALNHYVTQGFHEGRTASFNAQNYIASYGDLINAFGENQNAALDHYVTQGYYEGRTVTFDPVAYLLTYPDLQNAHLTAQTAATHYIDFGYKEGRSTSGAFGTEQTNHALTVDTPLFSDLITGDKDWFSINLTAGQSYDFSLAGAIAPINLPDPFLELHDSHGALLASDNDGGPGTDSLIHFTAPTTGLYYLVAASNQPGGAGNYKILTASA